MAKFIFKENNEGLSRCACDAAPAMSSCQLDCPWCGCGWLFVCSRCGKAFTYAVVLETDKSLFELGQQAFGTRGITDVTDPEIDEWANGMAEVLAPFESGQRIVYLDGRLLPIDATDVAFDGHFAHHEFDILPHAQALESAGVLRDTLGDVDYWLDRELPTRE